MTTQRIPNLLAFSFCPCQMHLLLWRFLMPGLKGRVSPSLDIPQLPTWMLWRVFPLMAWSDGLPGKSGTWPYNKTMTPLNFHINVDLLLANDHLNHLSSKKGMAHNWKGDLWLRSGLHLNSLAGRSWLHCCLLLGCIWLGIGAYSREWHGL